MKFLKRIEQHANAGMRPIIHFDTHGGKKDGLHRCTRDFIGT